MIGDRIEAYHFHESTWGSYDELRSDFEWEIPEQFNMATYVCDRWADEKGRVAVFGEQYGERDIYTFWELRNATNRLANYLQSVGVERGDRVGINTPQRVETLISHIACWKIGAVSIPLSTLFGPEAISYRLSDADADAAVVDESNIEDFREAREDVESSLSVVTVGDVTPGEGETDFWSALEDEPRTFDNVETVAETDAIIIYTSGTTGEPKGVRHAHRVLLGHLPLFITTFCNMSIRKSDVFWTPAEWAWIASLFDVVFSGLYYGQPIVAHNAGPFDAETAFDVIERYGVTNLFAPATGLRMMMQADDSEYDLGSVRCIPSGGESLGQNVAEWAEETFDGAVVHEGYGQTEANVLVGECASLFPKREGKMGKPGVGHEIAIVDPETAEATVDPGDVGEIAVRNPGDPVCFKEYWNKPGKTDEKVQDGWLLTEDLGEMDEEGYFEFESRKDDVIISAGYRIGPTEIEETLVGHDAVADSAVIGVPDEERGEVPKAFVVLIDGRTGDIDLRSELKQYVRDRLAQYEYPREIEFAPELPKTTTGKIRRTSLREREDIE